MQPAQKAWNGKIEDRLSVIQDLLSNIKSIRMTGLSDTLASAVREKFKIEVDTSKKFRFWLAIVFAIGTIPPHLERQFTNSFRTCFDCFHAGSYPHWSILLDQG